MEQLMKKLIICFIAAAAMLTGTLPAAASEGAAVLPSLAEETPSFTEETEPEETDVPVIADAAESTEAEDSEAETAEAEDSEAEDLLVLAADSGSSLPFTVSYSTHVQTYGWLDPVADGKESGTTGESKRMEGIRIFLENSPFSGSVQYCTHVQSYGWQDWRADGATAGTEGESKRLEAIRIRLTGELAEHYDIWYQTHIQHFGWSGWASNGEPCGSAGYSYRLEAIRILLTPAGEAAPGSISGIFREKSSGITDGAGAYDGTQIRYSTHVQTYGWQGFVFDGSPSGTTGQSKRLEGIRIALTDLPGGGGVRYRTHVQGYGWQGWRADGAVAGTVGEGRRLEAIRIELTGAAANSYDIYYRVHSQTFGWMAWAKNGQSAGTQGMRKRLEAIEIVITPKNHVMSGYDPGRAFKEAIKGNAVTWIGDSYSAINRYLIEAKLPGVDIQAQSAKFISFSYNGIGGIPGIPLTAGLKQSGQLRRTVVFALGTNSNDGVTQDELNQLRNLFGDSYKVVFVTARTNNSGYTSGNALLRDFVNRYPNYYLYDWAVHYRPAYMGGDGIHPNKTGINVWADGIIDVLNATV